MSTPLVSHNIPELRSHTSNYLGRDESTIYHLNVPMNILRANRNILEFRFRTSSHELDGSTIFHSNVPMNIPLVNRNILELRFRTSAVAQMTQMNT
ncbi:hypothetical protein E5U26_24810 [Burkholderia pseudomallei]|uniref:hypothetical protein n=1 Tax=Burkholderia pseudomallei TaxID=28450 RepID=UPI00155F709F|nr:hypothetical protein [Burkholderia pseudomallei]NRE33760.1 hypothetical protein [Burkholderia pseudomallei]